MSNAMIAHPAAPVAAMNRPVTVRDIAAALHMNPSTVMVYLHKDSNTPSVLRVKEYAQKVGYDGKAAQEFNNTHWHDARKHAKETDVRYYYCGGNFASKEAEVQRMKELRDLGYSNREIARKVGRSNNTVYNAIGPQDPELTKQSHMMASHIRAQKNAARKQYVLNRPILEYNAKVEEHNKLKAEVARMEKELKFKTPSIEKAAQIKIDFPLVNLSTLQPTALQ